LASIAGSLTGLLRRAFFEVFAYVKGVDVLGPSIVRELPTDSPYQAWLAQAAGVIPLHDGKVIGDVANIPLYPWPALGAGVSGLYLSFAGYQIIDGRILEIPVRGRTASQRQCCEIVLYFIGGSGCTILQQEGKPEQTVQWKQGSLLSVPLNVRHEHVNRGDVPARILAVTSFPFVLNALGSEDFIINNPYVFTDRYDASPDYFKPATDDGEIKITNNFVEDIRCVKTRPFDYRGKGNETKRLVMAGNSMLSIHVSEMPPQEYKKAHRQSGNAFVLMLSGEGYSLAWPEAAYHKKKRVDWKAGTLFVPPDYFYHQNFNSGSTPARYLAVNAPTLVRNLGLRFSDQLEVDLKEVRLEWERELEKRQ